MTVANTSVLVPLLDAGHPHHTRAQQDLAEGHITVTRGSLAEVATVVRRLAKDAGEDGNQAARRALAAITALAGFREAPHVGLEAVVKLHQQDRRLSFVDAWNLAVARHANEPLASYDEGLQAAYARRGKA